MNHTGSKFQKRQTVREVDIEGNIFSVDFGRDDIPLIFQQLAENISKPFVDMAEGIGAEEKFEALIGRQKEIFKEAIEGILGVSGVSEEIFRLDDTAVFHSDLYGYLVRLYQEVMLSASPYSPERLKQ